MRKLKNIVFLLCFILALYRIHQGYNTETNFVNNFDDFRKDNQSINQVDSYVKTLVFYGNDKYGRALELKADRIEKMEGDLIKVFNINLNVFNGSNIADSKSLWFNVEAPNGELSMQHKIMKLSGNVIITTNQGAKICADYVEVLFNKGYKVIGRNNVSLVTEDSVTFADYFEFDKYNGNLKLLGNVQFSKKIQK